MKQHAPELVTTKLRSLEGQRVKITLRDGSCLHGYEVVSAPRSRVHTLWLFGRGVDVFVAADDIYSVGAHRPEVQANGRMLSHTRA